MSQITHDTNCVISRPYQKNLISLQSSDGHLFQIDVREACISRLIKDAIDIDSIENDSGTDDDDIATNISSTFNYPHPPMELYNVQSECLQKIIEFMNHYAKQPMHPITTPLSGESIDDIVSPPWYGEFASGLEEEMIYQLVAASNYMDVEPLFRLMCLVVSVKLVGKTEEEIRSLLGIQELTEDEELKAREEHRWLFENN